MQCICNAEGMRTRILAEGMGMMRMNMGWISHGNGVGSDEFRLA